MTAHGAYWLCAECHHANLAGDEACAVCHDPGAHPALLGPHGPHRTTVHALGPHWVEVDSADPAEAESAARAILGEPDAADQVVAVYRLDGRPPAVHRVRAELHPYPSLALRGYGRRRPLGTPIGGWWVSSVWPGVISHLDPPARTGLIDLVHLTPDPADRLPARRARRVELGELVLFDYAEADWWPIEIGDRVEFDVDESGDVRRARAVTLRKVDRR